MAQLKNHLRRKRFFNEIRQGGIDPLSWMKSPRDEICLLAGASSQKTRFGILFPPCLFPFYVLYCSHLKDEGVLPCSMHFSYNAMADGRMKTP
jgi:hypothetical protein